MEQFLWFWHKILDRLSNHEESLLTYDQDLDPGLVRPESVDAFALIDPCIVAVGVADLQEVLVLPVADPGDVVDDMAVLE